MITDKLGEEMSLWGQGSTLQLSIVGQQGLSTLVTFCTWTIDPILLMPI